MRRLLRLGLPALAVYALVLQAFLVGAAPAAAFDAAGALLCSELTTSPDQPAPAGPHRHDVCVIHCAAPAFSGLVGAGDAALPPVRVALRAPQAPIADDHRPVFPRHRGPGARAPPQA